ncbi:MAG: zf-TFIIB domain-containing protein [Clostridiales bacterium]|nr:zf-TFIIB domain-containing protein [Clostridiales bacterium]
MYLDKSKATSLLVKGIIVTVIGSIMAILNFLFMLAVIYDGELGFIIAFLIFMLIGVGLIVLGVRNLVFHGTLTQLESIFCNDADGSVSLDELVKTRGAFFEGRVMRAVRKNYFQHLTYDNKNRVFELSDRVRGMSDYKTRFIGKNCPNCGAPLKIRKGTVTICEQCGGKVVS